MTDSEKKAELENSFSFTNDSPLKLHVVEFSPRSSDHPPTAHADCSSVYHLFVYWACANNNMANIYKHI